MNRDRVARVEAGGYATWSADETTEMYGWTLRANGGFTRRANSATAIGTAEVTPTAGAAIEEWLSARGARFAVRVTPLVDVRTVEAAATTWNLVPVDETLVLTSGLSAPSGETVANALVSPVDAAFTEDLLRLNGRPESARGPWRRIVERSAAKAAGIWFPQRAVGFVAMHEDMAYLYAVAVGEASRRRGLGTAVTRAAMFWATDHAATRIVLQVLGTNRPALGFYDALGFTRAYSYHYLQPPRPNTDGDDQNQGGP